jgi:hypothetical protein
MMIVVGRLRAFMICVTITGAGMLTRGAPSQEIAQLAPDFIGSPQLAPLVPGGRSAQMNPDGPDGLSIGDEEPGEKEEKDTDKKKRDRSSACDACDVCDFCDFPLLRISSLLLFTAAVVPDAGGRRPTTALIRFYRRHLSRFTPTCPSTPSCSAYALASVETLGTRRGLAAAAHRLRGCGRQAP